MAKRYEFSMDLDDEDDIVRVPLKSVSTQSTSTDWQRSPISNDKAATLSRQLAKYAQRRASRREKNRGNNLTPVAEGSVERSLSPNAHALLNSSSSHSGISSDQQKPLEPGELGNRLQSLNEFAQIEEELKNDPQYTGGSYVIPQNRPSSDSVSIDLEKDLAELERDLAALGEDSDEEFYDASTDFDADFLDQANLTGISTSCHADFANPADASPFAEGISVSRAAMSQSLMKVEEEPIAQIRITGNQTMQRSPRSTSVTARPSTAAGNFSTPQRNDTHHQIGFSNQNSLSPSNFDSPDFGGSAGAQKRQSRSPNKSDPNSTVGSLSTAFSNLNVKTSPESSMTAQARGSNSSLNSQPLAGNVGVTLQQSPAGDGASPSMTSSPRRNELEEVARKQEEALRLMVLQKQSAVRKSSGESNPDIQIQTTTPFTAGQVRNADANTSLKTPTTVFYLLFLSMFKLLIFQFIF
ncbi:hypothetical protein WR25_02612 [Diploscapter pachys]|uniref:Uncharacterized protein n=1 Tax=Diploscapter pachys TaxID=2018661 RepID=A0A2A2LAP2_9BILA|nr:hypothetical protein WR25_02612 [Diploscapter pachys]